MSLPGGRPKGKKDSRPRITRTQVVTARREQFDRWLESSGTWSSVLKRIKHIVEDEKTTNKEFIDLLKQLLPQHIGLPTEAKEPTPQQTLLIALPRPDGGYDRLEAGNVIDAEFSVSPPTDAETG